MTPAVALTIGLKSLRWGGLCPACGQDAGYTPALTCLDCALDLRCASPYDDWRMMEELAWRIPLRDACVLWTASPDSVAEALYKALKFGSKRHLGFPMGVWMARHRDQSYPAPDRVIPVPLSSGRLWSRGYNQAALLAQGMATHWGIPVLEHALSRRDGGLNLARLGRAERFAKAATDFEQGSKQDLRGLHCLVVDDVLTTGATLEQCGRLLVQRGAELSVMVLARRLGKRT